MASNRSTSRHDDDIHDFHQIANGIPTGPGTNGSSSAMGNAVAGPSMLAKPETRTPRPIAVPQNEPRTHHHKPTGWFNNTNDLRQGIKDVPSRGRAPHLSSNPVAANTLVSTKPDAQPPLKRPRYSEPSSRPGAYGRTRSINRDTGTDTGRSPHARTTKPRETASASASYASIDIADENEEEEDQVQVIERLLHPPGSPDPILLLNSGKGKAPHRGVDDHNGTRRLFHGSHTAALERKLQYPSSSHVARGEEAEDPIEVEEDSAEDEPSASRRTPSAAQIKPGTVSKYVSAIEDQEQKPGIKSNSKARHVDLRNPPHASRKPPSAVKTRMAVRNQYNPDVASSSTNWNTKNTKSAAQQKSKPLSLKVKLLYFGNEKFEPTDNDPIFLHVNTSIMEIKHGPPKKKSMRTDTINIEDVSSLQLCNTNRQVIYITLNKQLNIGQLNFRRDSNTFTSGHEKAITIEFQAPTASFNSLSGYFTEHGLNKSFIDDNAANTLLQRAEMLFENFKSSSGGRQSSYARRQSNRQSRSGQSSKYFDDSVVYLTDSEDSGSRAGPSTNGVKSKPISIPIAPDDDAQDLIIQETSMPSRSRSPPVLMHKTRSATRKAKPIAIPTRAPPTPPPPPSPPRHNRVSSPLSSLPPDSPQPEPERKLPSGGPDKLVLVYPPTGKGTLNILRSDINRLAPGEYLNDTLIEFGLKRWYNELQERDPSLAEQVYVFNSFLFKKLQDKKPEKGYASVRKWTQRFDLFKKKYIIVPINEHLHWYLAIIYQPDAILEPPPPPEPPRQSVSSRTRSNRTPNTVSNEQDSKPASTNSTDVTEMLMAECSINEIPETPPPAHGSPAQSAPASDDVMAIDDNSNPVIEITETHSDNEGYTNDVPKSSSSKDDANVLESVRPVNFYGASSAPSIQEITISKQPRPELESVDLSLDDRSDDEVEEDKMMLDAPAPASVQEMNKSQTWIFTLDSLNSSHKQAADILKIYLQMEAQDKKGITAPGKATSKKIWVPSQNNLWDCGVYLLHFAEVFLKDPEHYCQLMINRSTKKSTSSQELIKEWRAENLDSKRTEIRTFIEDAAKIWTIEQERKRLEEPDVAKEESSDDEVIIEPDVVLPEPSPQGVRTRGKRKAQDMEDTPEAIGLAMRPRG